MARFPRLEVLSRMQTIGMVPVFYHPDAKVCLSVLAACYEGGVSVFEFTNRGDFAHQTFATFAKEVHGQFRDVVLGVGSVVDAGTASLYMQLGADFVVSPVLVPEMARTLNRRKVAWIPGCGSLSEISQAEELGAEIVKIFPGSQVGGPSFVKAVRGPCPWTSIMPTGGVEPNEASLRSWFEAGVACVGMGSQLMAKHPDGTFDLAAITQRTRDALAIIRSVRGS